MPSLEHKGGHSVSCSWDDTVYPFTNVLYGAQDWIAWTQEVKEKIDLPNPLFDELLMLYTHL